MNSQPIRDAWYGLMGSRRIPGETLENIVERHLREGTRTLWELMPVLEVWHKREGKRVCGLFLFAGTRFRHVCTEGNVIEGTVQIGKVSVGDREARSLDAAKRIVQCGHRNRGVLDFWEILVGGTWIRLSTMRLPGDAGRWIS